MVHANITHRLSSTSYALRISETKASPFHTSSAIQYLTATTCPESLLRLNCQQQQLWHFFPDRSGQIHLLDSNPPLSSVMLVSKYPITSTSSMKLSQQMCTLAFNTVSCTHDLEWWSQKTSTWQTAPSKEFQNKEASTRVENLLQGRLLSLLVWSPFLLDHVPEISTLKSKWHWPNLHIHSTKGRFRITNWTINIPHLTMWNLHAAKIT